MQNYEVDDIAPLRKKATPCVRTGVLLWSFDALIIAIIFVQGNARKHVL